MKYAKPEVRTLSDAAEVIQSGAKGSVMAVDATPPHTTVSAYEADE